MSELICTVSTVPLVEWARHDLDDGSATVSAETVLRDYRHQNDPRTPRVYQEYVALVELRETLWEETDGLMYDWSAYHHDGVFPPIKLMRGGLRRPSTFVVDGNHRIRFWRQCGYRLAPAWVLDYRELS